jgi:hypothetical protein
VEAKRQRAAFGCGPLLLLYAEDILEGLFAPGFSIAVCSLGFHHGRRSALPIFEDIIRQKIIIAGLGFAHRIGVSLARARRHSVFFHDLRQIADFPTGPVQLLVNALFAGGVLIGKHGGRYKKRSRCFPGVIFVVSQPETTFMNYELKIEGGDGDVGKIELKRLAIIADTIRKVAEGALQIRLSGVSVAKGKRKISVDDALNVYLNLNGNNPHDTILHLESSVFADTLVSAQLDLFRQEAQQQLTNFSPVSLFVAAFRDALSDDAAAKDYLDKPLLHNLARLKSAFGTDSERFIIMNEGSFAELSLQRTSFQRIRTLEHTIPEPQVMIVSGKVDLIEHSRMRVRIATAQGMIDGLLGEQITPDAIVRFWGRDVTLHGTAYYKPNKKFILAIERISEPAPGDAQFSAQPRVESFEDQIERQLNARKHRNTFGDLIGKWPGDESFDELLGALTK